MINAITLPPEIVDGIIALGAAILGWITRWLSRKKLDEAIKKENDTLKEAVKEYNSIAREAINDANQTAMNRARARVGKMPTEAKHDQNNKTLGT